MADPRPAVVPMPQSDYEYSICKLPEFSGKPMSSKIVDEDLADIFNTSNTITRSVTDQPRPFAEGAEQPLDVVTPKAVRVFRCFSN